MDFTDDMGEDEFPPPPPLVDVDVEEDRVVWVRISEDWKEHVMPNGLLSQVRTAVMSACSFPGSWVDTIDLTKVPIPHLREFNALLNEARAEENTSDSDEVEVRTRHFVSRWREGFLIGLTGDVEWMSQAARQALCEELSSVVARPEDPTYKTTARDRFVRFMKEYA